MGQIVTVEEQHLGVLANFDGNPYESIQMLAHSQQADFLIQKKLICCVLNGFDPERYLEMHRFGPSDAPIDKPQYIHSAAAIYLVMRNESLRQADGFWKFIIEQGYTQASIKIAENVLRTDPDAFDYITTVENDLRGSYFICDESGKTLHPNI